ncbi:MAG: hypothetical protein QOG14_1466, partial [Mycobacterium sp.]|nr:hypothetical protein [Mycobacterium sp.]
MSLLDNGSITALQLMDAQVKHI